MYIYIFIVQYTLERMKFVQVTLKELVVIRSPCARPMLRGNAKRECCPQDLPQIKVKKLTSLIGNSLKT